MLDIKITNAKTRNTGKELVEIGIENGKITAIASAVEGEAKQVIDAKGNLDTFICVRFILWKWPDRLH